MGRYRSVAFPDELHEVIHHGLGSLRAVERDDRYRVDMEYSHWGHPRWGVWNVTSWFQSVTDRRKRETIVRERSATRQHADYGYACTVGWAGAVMATTLGVTPRTRHAPRGQWGPMVERRLDALDSLARTRDVFRLLAVLRRAICHRGTNHYTTPVGETADGILLCDCGLTRLRRALAVDYPGGFPAYEAARPAPFHSAMTELAQLLANYAHSEAVWNQFIPQSASADVAPREPPSANPHWEQDARLVRERGGWRSRAR